MRNAHTEKLKGIIRPFFYKLFKQSGKSYLCPICGYQGPFKDKRISKQPDLVRIDSKCPKCASNERHRMMYLVFNEVFNAAETQGKSVLHIAPEDCLKDLVAEKFETYHTADLLKQDVDFNEDVQAMSFNDNSYDCVVISRVLTIPPDLDASLSEIHRVLKPGGLAVIAEIYKHEETKEFGKMINERSREIGIDLIDKIDTVFDEVECFSSNRYDEQYQLANKMVLDGQPTDNFPDKVKINNVGFSELVVIGKVANKT
ncbi:class I SAM-dependent methyltransferase [uncultured Cocleimonas sp.]|uniref:class I SAM-dependent methyltransferase n=1 Tax=uncultured Cocleimonas sp. TaxID=1051587 RepID=UPI00262DA127|nr:methyltransferase domain-containing protein [uncultured Cocleimonas sp.]